MKVGVVSLNGVAPRSALPRRALDVQAATPHASILPASSGVNPNPAYAWICVPDTVCSDASLTSAATCHPLLSLPSAWPTAVTAPAGCRSLQWTGGTMPSIATPPHPAPSGTLPACRPDHLQTPASLLDLLTPRPPRACLCLCQRAAMQSRWQHLLLPPWPHVAIASVQAMLLVASAGLAGWWRARMR